MENIESGELIIYTDSETKILRLTSCPKSRKGSYCYNGTESNLLCFSNQEGYLYLETTDDFSFLQRFKYYRIEIL